MPAQVGVIPRIRVIPGPDLDRLLANLDPVWAGLTRSVLTQLIGRHRVWANISHLPVIPPNAHAKKNPRKQKRAMVTMRLHRTYRLVDNSEEPPDDYREHAATASVSR